ncbi:oligosaccharide flippase family protein [Brucella anthropi]|uniref:Oligosaccharide flippase family protein n=1 Tax=Brucella anthropi TaxID=529 RepID=A0A6I0DCF8_BRUAN|nr:oligosaccharide flippase family protein [Brucella anthropi]KAB2769178.1 oligosaccharide flippase family protein [Brucella anthropi]KAB2786931.1 oligosaccharide flippase family protein [Brucella anthropi]UVV68993.1 oligosaccharide flippase family protein [Brucella anthropi]
MNGSRRGILMAALEQYAALIFNFLTVVIISRVLNPAETGMGVIGISISAIVFSLREFASAEFLIKLDRVEDKDLQTSLTYLMSVTLVLAATLYALRGFFAASYQDPMLGFFLDITIAAALVETLSMPIIALLRREMAFGVLARIRTVGSGLGALATIVSAYMGFGYLCFAIGLLGSAVATTSLAITIHPLRRLLRPTFASIDAAWRFGIYLGANSSLGKICETFPSLILGRFMPISQVGIYNRAGTVSGLPDRVILSAIFAVAFPMLSAQVREGVDIRQSYIRALSYISVVYWPAQVVLAFLAYPAVRIILGSGWHEAVPIVAISCTANMFWCPVLLTYPLLMALGHNRDAFVFSLISRSVVAPVLCVAAFFGLFAVALSQFITSPFQMVVSILYVKKYVSFSQRELFGAFAHSALVTALTLILPFAALVANGFSFDFPPLLGVGIGLVAAMSWIIAVFVTRHPFGEELNHVFITFANMSAFNRRIFRRWRHGLISSTPAE